jgi:hypothetical protein
MQTYQQAREDYARLSAPFIRAKCQIYAVMQIKILIKPSGEIIRIECPTAEQADGLRLLDECLQMVMTSCFARVNVEFTLGTGS